MADIILFGGTTEGREIANKFAEEFKGSDVRLCVCVATEYGATLLEESDNVEIHIGALNEEQMKQFISEKGATLCVDATHPYAAAVTANIVTACDELEVAYVRVIRELVEEENISDNPDVILVENVKEAVDFLNDTEGKIFVTTGSKELEAFTKLKGYRSRCIARVLSTLPVMLKCNNLGFEGKNLIMMQGPFSEELNYQMFIASEAKWLVTKNSGSAGGFEEKCEAALRAGMKLVIIGRPEEKSKNFVGIDESLEIMRGIYKL